MTLTLVFRVFAALLAIFGALNILLLILSDRIVAFFPVQFHAVNTLTEATALFGVGAGIYLLASAQSAKKAHH
jgi:hypothetical protein